MQVFEFHFNPPKKQSKGNDLIFDSFCYEPENFYEKKLGNLYLVGLIKNSLPQHARFLDNLAKIIKEKYYQTISAGSEKSLKESLKKANLFLENLSKSGDVSWLGNLNFAVAALNLNQKNGGELNFTKVGGLKIFLLRGGQVIDIDGKLKFEEIEPYPLKVFGNIVSGKLAEGDIFLILTKDVANFFKTQNLLAEISKLAPFDQQRLKGILNKKKEGLLKISGLCLLILCSKENILQSKETIQEKKLVKIFSFKEALAPAVNLIKIPTSFLQRNGVYGKAIAARAKTSALPRLPAFSLPILSFNKNLFLIPILIILVLAGFFIFERQEKAQLKGYFTQMEQIRKDVEEANKYLVLADNNPQAQKKANNLLKNSLNQIIPLTKISPVLSADFTKQVSELQDNILNSLYQLNKVQIMADIQPIYQFKNREFAPQNIVYFKENLYLFTPYADNIFEINPGQGLGKTIPTKNRYDLAVPLADSILFFSKPNRLTILKDGQFQETFAIEAPYPNYTFSDLSSYLSNLYFLDSKNGEIVKYPYTNNYKWDLPQFWLNPKIKRATDAKSITANGPIWVLNKNTALEQYYSGNLQATLNLDTFPAIQDVSRILTTPKINNLLFLLDPIEKRVIVLDKTGGIVKQFKSDLFDNLQDFAIADDGKSIYLLNGPGVFEIDL